MGGSRLDGGLQDQFAERSRVLIVGLAGKPKYNGLMATVVRHDRTTGRITVNLDEDEMKQLSLKPENLEADPVAVLRTLREAPARRCEILRFLYQRGSLLYNAMCHADGIATLNEALSEVLRLLRLPQARSHRRHGALEVRKVLVRKVLFHRVPTSTVEAHAQSRLCGAVRTRRNARF